MDVADEDLALLARAGDVDAFVHLARTRGDRQFGLARRILRDFDLAEDAVQQALVIAWRELPRLRDPGRFDAWLTRIVDTVQLFTIRVDDSDLTQITTDQAGYGHYRWGSWVP
jgi:RNA polymerase sigma-70 factor (ECF subfamily)